MSEESTNSSQDTTATNNIIYVNLEPENVRHLFLLAPNNSGSTYIQECFKNCYDVSVLNDEGQWTPSFQGITPSMAGVPFIWTKKSRAFSNITYQEMGLNASLWEEAWSNNNPDAKWRFQKTPVDILRPGILLDTFVNLSFLIMVRNPYAMAESILRANPMASIEDIGNHVLDCLTIQRNNNYLTGNNFTFTYEDMCDRPEWVEAQIAEKYGIADFKLTLENSNANMSDKGARNIEVYGPALVNANKKQIGNLKKYHIEALNSIFIEGKETLEYWGYEIIDPFYIGFKAKKMFEYDTSALKEKIASLDSSNWIKSNEDYASFETHHASEFIIAFNEPDGSDDPYFGKEEVRNTVVLDAIELELKDLTNKILDKFKIGRPKRLVISKLEAGQYIPEHNATNDYLNKCRRLYLPIETNSSCELYIEREKVDIEENTLYEIDNSKTTSVDNMSDRDRIFMIIDWMY